MPRMLDSQPAIYRNLLPAFFQSEVPDEAKATCSSCAMCESSCSNAVTAVDGESRLFRPDAKCCTYHPRLPNYLVGALLADQTGRVGEGQARLRAKLAHRSGVTPQWVKAPPKYDLLYATAKNAFGRSKALICPFYAGDAGSCTIWPYREAVCSTFFCKYVAGADGRTFWMSLKRYLSLVEAQLSRYALLKIFPEYIWKHGEALGQTTTSLSAEELDDGPPPEGAYRELWGQWSGREAELYIRSYELVRDLTAAEVERLLGLDGEIYQGLVTQRYQAAVHPALPEVLKLNPNLTVKHLGDGAVALGFHSEYDALALPVEAFHLLEGFRGDEPVAAVRARLRDERETDFADELLIQLHQHRILI